MNFTKLTSIAVLASLAACGKSPSSSEATAAAPAAVAAAVPAEAANAPAAPAGVNGTPVDACALLDGAAASGSVGTLIKEPEAQAAQGSFLGGCNYMGERGLLMVSARPAGEYQGTVDYAGKKSGVRAIDNLPGPATMTSAGLMLHPSDKPYFLVVYPMLGGKFDEAAALQIASKLKL